VTNTVAFTGYRSDPRTDPRHLQQRAAVPEKQQPPPAGANALAAQVDRLYIREWDHE